MNILVCYDKSGPKYIRLLLPIHTFPDEIRVVHKPKEEDYEWADVVFFNRLISMDITAKDLVEQREKHGFKLICDLDDHWRLGKDHLLYENYKHSNLSEKIEEHIGISDYVFVTHDRLRDEVLPFNSCVYILPNAIPKLDQYLTKKVPDEKTRLFWAGGITHRKDLELIQKPIRNLKMDNCKFVLCGYVDENYEWKQVAKLFDKTGVQIVHSLEVHEYYKLYSLCDISLIPLVDNHFNSYKSNLKILEAANIESPVIVSRVHPYLGFPESVVNYVDGYNSTWFSNIKKLLASPSMVKEQGIALREYCDEHYNFEKINTERKQIFDHVAG